MSTAQHILAPQGGPSLEAPPAPRRARLAALAEVRATRAPRLAPWWTGLAAALAWAALGALTLLWPNKPAGFSDWAYTDAFAWFGMVSKTHRQSDLDRLNPVCRKWQCQFR
jgi:NitT/TauT family transport system permease protein